jgi:hypothetical protein
LSESSRLARSWKFACPEAGFSTIALFGNGPSGGISTAPTDTSLWLSETIERIPPRRGSCSQSDNAVSMVNGSYVCTILETKCRKFVHSDRPAALSSKLCHDMFMETGGLIPASRKRRNCNKIAK